MSLLNELRPLPHGHRVPLQAIFSFYDRTGACPTYQELADMVGLGSSAAAARKVGYLERLGLVTRTLLRRSRNILVTEEGKALLSLIEN